VKLGATLCRVFPQLKCDFPRDASGQLIPRKLPEATLTSYQGFLGHFHIQTNKVDPGPAFQWQGMMDKIQRYLIHLRRSPTGVKGSEALQGL